MECRPQGSPFKSTEEGAKNRIEVGEEAENRAHLVLPLLSLSPSERVLFFGWLVVSWFSSLLERQLHKDRDLSSCHSGPSPALGKVPGRGQVFHNSIKGKS